MEPEWLWPAAVALKNVYTGVYKGVQAAAAGSCNSS